VKKFLFIALTVVVLSTLTPLLFSKSTKAWDGVQPIQPCSVITDTDFIMRMRNLVGENLTNGGSFLVGGIDTGDEYQYLVMYNKSTQIDGRYNIIFGVDDSGTEQEQMYVNVSGSVEQPTYYLYYTQDGTFILDGRIESTSQFVERGFTCMNYVNNADYTPEFLAVQVFDQFDFNNVAWPDPEPEPEPEPTDGVPIGFHWGVAVSMLIGAGIFFVIYKLGAPKV